jgi:hypothetical protein
MFTGETGQWSRFDANYAEVSCKKHLRSSADIRCQARLSRVVLYQFAPLARRMATVQRWLSPSTTKKMINAADVRRQFCVKAVGTRRGDKTHWFTSLGVFPYDAKINRTANLVGIE